MESSVATNGVHSDKQHETAEDTLRLDLDELRELRKAATRPAVQDLLDKRIASLGEQIKRLAESRMPQPVPTDSKTSHATADTPKVEGQVRFSSIQTYGWDQDGSDVKLYIDLPGVHEIPSENVRMAFHEESIDLQVVGLKGKNHRLTVRRLSKPINVSKCTYKVKKNAVHITLKKRESGWWEQIHWKENKLSSMSKNKDMGADPNASIMNLMKDLYQEGDDDMKRMIAKCWTETQEKKTAGLDPSSLGGMGGMGGLGGMGGMGMDFDKDMDDL
ncbi:unnamed protein product [Vitrella brassicaformis CCMP3155]|uniref:Calcyclin-binding protein n=2 Tax=Vitrella brassicaformis TaxID=1169539 RepID=A0A0G4EE27_VITBC|nr:unnamed protein product [Vitrella brassicaformis CCMP3155]|eukprot:CEL93999.1 unnamed protein product [Vitrella brassicaformis CCMP3155]